MLKKYASQLRDWVLGLPIVHHLVSLSKKLVLPGFDGLPLYDVIRFFFRAIQKGRLSTRASAIAFSFFLALFPAIIFLFSLIPYFPIQDFEQELLLQLAEILPANAFESAQATIDDLVHRKHEGLLSFGFVFTIYFASNGINRMIGSFNQSIYAVEQRKGLVQRAVSLALLFIITLLMVISVALIVFKGLATDYLLESGILSENILVFLEAANWTVSVAFFYFAISFIYWLGPAGRSKWKFFSAGSTLATALLIVVSVGFAYFVNNFGQYNKLYGSIGTLIVILLWINFNSLILLVGYELNASIVNAPERPDEAPRIEEREE